MNMCISLVVVVQNEANAVRSPEDTRGPQSGLAKRMKTSRTQLDRLLNSDDQSVTLGALARAAQAVGRHLRMELV